MPKTKQDALVIPFSVGHGNKGRVKNRSLPWAEFREMFRKPYRTDETFAQYLQLDLSEKLKKKNAAGFFFAAHCKGGSRKKEAVQDRAILTVDLDEHVRPVIRKIKRGEVPICKYEWIAHTTRSSSIQNPRYRIIVPLARRIKPEEHEPLSRIVSQMIDPTMRAIDPVSHRVAQMMFLPVASRDQDYRYTHHQGELLDPDEIIRAWEAEHGEGSLFNWDALPRNPEKEDSLRDRMKKAGWPLDKPGLVGMWCRFTESIHHTIAEYLQEFYGPTEDPNRYQAIGGSGLAGVVIYEDQWLYSHHTTDPCAGELCNSFDAVRLCLFGDKDKGADPDLGPTDMPSFKAMKKWMHNIPAFTRFVAEERFGDVDDAYEDGDIDGPIETLEAAGDEEDLLGDMPVPEKPEKPVSGHERPDRPEESETEDPHAWVSDLQVTKEGALRPTEHNLFLIMTNDRRFKDAWAFNEMSRLTVRRRALRLRLPGVSDLDAHDLLDNEVGITDQDARLVKVLLSRPTGKDISPRGYGVEYGLSRIQDTISTIAHSNTYNPVRLLLERLPKWDGVKRAETLFVDYLATPDTPYYREAARVALLGAVARVMQPGISFDLMPILTGGQGARKSSFVQVLAFGRPWKAERGYFSVLPNDLNDRKKVFEALSGAWFVETAEMVAFRKGDSDALKRFVTETVDKVRPAYERQVVAAKRTFVLWGTTNEKEFLRDPTGNRRYLPIYIGGHLGERHPIDTVALTKERDQIWAEVLHWWRSGDRRLSLDAATRQEAEAVRAQAFEELPEKELADEIDEYYTKPKPIETFLGDVDDYNTGGMGMWRAVCAKQVWEDLLDGRGDFLRRESKFISRALRMTKHFNKRTRTRGPFGNTWYWHDQQLESSAPVIWEKTEAEAAESALSPEDDELL